MILNILANSGFLNVSWKTILVIFIILVSLFAFIGLIGLGIKKLMNYYGRSVDNLMSKLVISRAINNPADFRRIAFAKSYQSFYKASIAPTLLMITALVIYCVYHLIDGNWMESIFDIKTGIGTLFHVFDWSTLEYFPPLGFDFENLVMINEPHFLSGPEMTNYFIFLLGFSGVIYYLFVTLAKVSRDIRIIKLAKTMFRKDLDNVDLNSFYNTNLKMPKSDQQIKKEESVTQTLPQEINK